MSLNKNIIYKEKQKSDCFPTEYHNLCHCGTWLCQPENYIKRDIIAGLRCVSPSLQRLRHIGEFSGSKTVASSLQRCGTKECICGKYQENGTDLSVCYNPLGCKTRRPKVAQFIASQPWSCTPLQTHYPFYRTVFISASIRFLSENEFPVYIHCHTLTEFLLFYVMWAGFYLMAPSNGLFPLFLE